MSAVVVVRYLVTLQEATKIIRCFKKKKHSGAGYFFELDDLGVSMLTATEINNTDVYGKLPQTSNSTWWKESCYLLKVSRDVRCK